MRLLTISGVLVALAGALLLWQRYGLAVVLGDGSWLCITG